MSGSLSMLCGISTLLPGHLEKDIISISHHHYSSPMLSDSFSEAALLNSNSPGSDSFSTSKCKLLLFTVNS